MMGQLSLEQMETEQLRQQVADLSARLDTAQVMILERDAIIAGQAGRLAERDAKRPGRHNLIALRKATDDACAAAWEDCAECRDEAVNWADLKCAGAEWFVDDDGVPGIGCGWTRQIRQRTGCGILSPGILSAPGSPVCM